MDVLEKLFPLIFLIIWSVIAAQARKRKKQQMEEEGEVVGRQTERPRRQQSAPPRKERNQGGESVFESLKRSIETMANELEGGGEQAAIPKTPRKQPPAKKSMEAAEKARQERMQKGRLGKSRIEETTEKTEGKPLRRTIQEISPYDIEPTPYKMRKKPEGVLVESADLAPTALRKAIVLKEILDRPTGLRAE